MTTTMRKPSTKRTATTPAQLLAVRNAYNVLRGITAHGTADAAAMLQDAFPAVFVADDTPLFGDSDQPTATGWDYDNGERHGLGQVYEYETFPGRETLPDDHPRVQAFVQCFEVPSRPPLFAADPKWQLDCLWERWRYRHGEVPYSRWAKEVKPALQVYTLLDLWNAMEAYRESMLAARQSYGSRLAGFLDHLPQWLQHGRMPYRNEMGDLTTRGRIALGER